jgi:anti-anti-sigma factor
MNLTVISDDEDVLHVQCAGVVSQDSFVDDAEPLEKLLSAQGGFKRRVMLNMERATHIDSSGISWLLVSYKHFRENGGLLVLHSVPPLIDQVVQLVKLPRIVPFAKDLASARAIALGAEP